MYIIYNSVVEITVKVCGLSPILVDQNMVFKEKGQVVQTLTFCLNLLQKLFCFLEVIFGSSVSENICDYYLLPKNVIETEK